MNTRKAGPTNQRKRSSSKKVRCPFLATIHPSKRPIRSNPPPTEERNRRTFYAQKRRRIQGEERKKKRKKSFRSICRSRRDPRYTYLPTYLPSYTSTQRDWYHFREKTVRGSNEWGGKMSRERNESQTWSPFIHYFIFERWFSFPWAPFLSTSPRSVMKIFISFPFSRFSPASAISQRNGKGVKGTGVFLTRSWQKKFPSFLRFLIETFLPRSAVDKLVRTYVCECLGS